MAKKTLNTTFLRKKIKRKGRHSKKHLNRKKSNRGQGFPI